MHQFFGILRSNIAFLQEAHRECWNTLARKFPSAFGNAAAFNSEQLEIWGDVLHVAGAGRSDLYFCGEIYDIGLPPTGATPLQQVETLLAQIDSKGLHAAVSALNGRFMICYLDHIRLQAHVLTDHSGIQQIYYYQGKDFLLFGSEIKYLLNHPLCPKQIDWYHSLLRPLPFEVLDGERDYHSWFKDIYLLEEAGDLSLDLQTGAYTKRCYWDPYASNPAPDDTRGAKQVMDEYIQLLEDAVRIRIQDGDTAYSFLSGGLDSSIICALAARIKPLETFSVITQTTMLEDTSGACFLLSRDLGFNNMQAVVPYHRIVFNRDLWKKQIWRAESPFNHTDSLTKTLLHDAIRRRHPNIMYTLTGTGSDQLNGGLTRWIVNDAGNATENWSNLIGKVAEAEHRHHLPERVRTLWESRAYLNRDFIAGISGRPLESNTWMFYVKSNVHINRFELLWDENHAAASHGHSARFPFLDHRFLPFIAGIPQHLHPELFCDKQILRLPAAAYLPKGIFDKPKAPANTGRYDHRFEMYRFLIGPDKLDLLEEALGPLQEPHPVIDKKAFLAGLQHLTQKPDYGAWQYFLHVLNLGLLEKLHAQDEASLRYEDEVEPLIEIITELSPPTKARICRELDIAPEEELLQKPLQFAPGCSLVTEHPGGTVYINKNEMLVYELNDENPLWRNFLFAINNNRSAAEILGALGADFTGIREYFYLCLEENILLIE